MSAQATAIATIADLCIRFESPDGPDLLALNHVSLEVQRGESLGIVGESGSGKSMLCMALMGMVPPSGRLSGQVEVAGVDLASAPPRAKRRLLARHIGLVMQDPTSSLNPLRKVGSQMIEAARLAGLPRSQWKTRLRRELEAVGLDPEEVANRYPFELSGGMNQRVVIAMALIKSPALLLADEPTTALDVETQANILALLAQLRREREMTTVIVSHDIAVVSSIADRLAVLYGGRLMELGSASTVIDSPAHPYTQALLAAIPTVKTPREARIPTIPGRLTQFSSDYAGCPFAPRCSGAQPRCDESFPEATEVTGESQAWCWAVAAQPAQRGGAR